MSHTVSVRVALGVALVPGPGGADNGFELGVFGLPTQLTDCLLRGGDQPRRVAGAPRLLDGRDRFAGYLLTSANDFADGIAIAVAQVIEALPSWRQAEDMRLRQVQDVNVIPDARAVGRGIIGAENLAVRLPDRKSVV